MEQVPIEELAQAYHEACREMVNSGTGMITKPTRPYIEWKDLTEDQKNGRRLVARNLLAQFVIMKNAEIIKGAWTCDVCGCERKFEEEPKLVDKDCYEKYILKGLDT